MQREIYYKPSEASLYFGCDASTVIRYIHSKQIKALTTHTGRYLIPESEIKKYLTECESRTEQLYLQFN